MNHQQSKFENMGNTIIGRIDDVGTRIETLEKSIADLMDNPGMSESAAYNTGTSGSSLVKKNHSEKVHDK